MKASEIVNNIKDFCSENANEEIVKKYSYYFKGEYNAYGLSNDMIPNKLKEYKKQEWFTIDFVYEVSRLLVKEEKYELPSFAMWLLKEFTRDFNYKTFKEIEYWFSVGINNWAHTDSIVQYFFPVLWKNKIIRLEDLSDWRNAKNKFQRRCVPVAMIKLLKHNTNYRQLFAFIDPLMMDTELKVQQGLGWFLRECWKRNREVTEEFLLKWKNDCARIIIQYATEKMTKEERLRFKKNKK